MTTPLGSDKQITKVPSKVDLRYMGLFGFNGEKNPRKVRSLRDLDSLL